MVYANQNYSREFANQKKKLKVCVSCFEIICAWDEAGTICRILLKWYRFIYGHLFDNSIKIIKIIMVT